MDTRGRITSIELFQQIKFDIFLVRRVLSYLDAKEDDTKK